MYLILVYDSFFSSPPGLLLSSRRRSNSYLTLAVRDDPTHYQLAYFAGFLPTVERTPKCWLAVGEVPITKDSKVVD